MAVITGGSAGIGLATAELFLDEGARVILAGSSAGKGQAALQALAAKGKQAEFVQTDVSDEAQVRALFARAEAQYGRLDSLVCAAGCLKGVIPTENYTEAEWDLHMNVNAKGTFLCVKHAVPLLRRSGGGTIVTFSSLAAVRPKPARVAYVAAKAAIVQMTKAMAIEFAPEIRVNCVVPGLIDTEMGRAIPPEDVEAVCAAVPAKRIGQPKEIADAVLFLSCADSSYAYGTELHIDGGDSI